MAKRISIKLETKTLDSVVNLIKWHRKTGVDVTDIDIEKIIKSDFKPARDGKTIEIGQTVKINYKSFNNCLICGEDVIYNPENHNYIDKNHHSFQYHDGAKFSVTRNADEQMTEEMVEGFETSVIEIDDFLDECIEKKWDLSYRDIQTALSGKFSILRGNRIKVGDEVVYRSDEWDYIHCPICTTTQIIVEDRTFTCCDNHYFTDIRKNKCIRRKDKK